MMQQPCRLILTNNPGMASAAAGFPAFEVLLYPSDCEELLLKCKELIQEGWEFAADPLGGYYFRPNPYHTLFLKRGLFFGEKKRESKMGRAHDSRLVECMQELCRKHQKFIERYGAEVHGEDYRIMDSSVAQRSLMRLNEIIY